MRVLVFLNSLSLGGTEKAACLWAAGLAARGHQVAVLSLENGPRRIEIEKAGLPLFITESDVEAIGNILKQWVPDVIHAHVSGFPHAGDILGVALEKGRRIPVVQTNVFGQLENPKEDAWTSHRLFISWTSCVQAALRSATPLNEHFFKKNSVAVFPLPTQESAAAGEISAFRQSLGIGNDDVLFGRFGRPDPRKWSTLSLGAIKMSIRGNPCIKVLFQEAPSSVIQDGDPVVQSGNVILRPMASGLEDLRLAMSSIDVVLHTSCMGESFGYGIAEPMNLAKPVVTNPVPWMDQAQVELVKHGQTGFLAGTSASMAHFMRVLAEDRTLRAAMGAAAREHIRRLADPAKSLDRVEAIFKAAVEKRDNPFARDDLAEATKARENLAVFGYGATPGDRISLRLRHLVVLARQHLGKVRRNMSHPIRIQQ